MKPHWIRIIARFSIAVAAMVVIVPCVVVAGVAFWIWCKAPRLPDMDGR